MEYSIPPAPPAALTVASPLLAPQVASVVPSREPTKAAGSVIVTGTSTVQLLSSTTVMVKPPAARLLKVPEICVVVPPSVEYK